MSWFITSDIEIDEAADNSWSDLYDPDNVPVDVSTWTSQFMIRINLSDLNPALTLTVGTGITLAADSTVTSTISRTQASALVVSIPGLSAFFAHTLIKPDGTIIPFKRGGVTIARNASR